ncbi:uncharacterized protein LOC134186044 [Corticium candelabrum]|uniref:uncharacterized protein LOC134186044 n=1 Tax=Corticium candelabrum TaxID=121492 RepID=UPI002E271405|nr:uncharacterized protein LOC134186044 [Corticium candelabrum]
MAALMDKTTTQDQCVPGAINYVLEQCIEETIEEVASSSCSTDDVLEKPIIHKTRNEKEKEKTNGDTTKSDESVGVRLKGSPCPKRRKIEETETETVVLLLPAEEDRGSSSSVKDELHSGETEFHNVVATVPRRCDEAVVPSDGHHEE